MHRAAKERPGAAQRGLPAIQTDQAKPTNLPDWVLPAIRGVQAGREYYAVMVRLRDIPAFSRPSTHPCPQGSGHSGR